MPTVLGPKQSKAKHNIYNFVTSLQLACKHWTAVAKRLQFGAFATASDGGIEKFIPRMCFNSQDVYDWRTSVPAHIKAVTALQDVRIIVEKLVLVLPLAAIPESIPS